MDTKLYLITSLDDHSRLMLFAELFERETTWNHIEALRHVLTAHGAPLKYYADQHAIFRYVKDRDTLRPHNEYTTFTDDVDPQWKAVLKRCGSDVIYALSPQAKGKIERPYRWIQDRLVRTAAKEKLTTIDEMRDCLRQLIEMGIDHFHSREFPFELRMVFPIPRRKSISRLTSRMTLPYFASRRRVGLWRSTR